MPATDALDDRILHHLRLDGRAPYTEIAEAVDTSEATVRSRVRRMEEDGIIQQFTVRIRGANVRALVEVGIETNVLGDDVADQVLELAGVEEVWELTGDWDLVALVNVDSTQGLNDVVDGIRRIKPARATRTRVILNERFPTKEPQP